MKYRIVHNTEYASVDAVSIGHNEAWLTPRNTPYQQVLQHRLEISPEPSACSTLTDYFGNTVTQFIFHQGYEKLKISSIDEVEILDQAVATDPGLPWEQVRDDLRVRPTPEALQSCEFVFGSPRCRTSTEFAEYGRAVFQPGRPLREALAELLQTFHSEFQYDPTATTVFTPVEQVFRQRRGVCQDFAHLMISVLRSLGLAARYVSGYLRTLPPPGKPRLVGADASHAWLSVYGGPQGWIDIDPTNNLFLTANHITIAWGRDYADVAPVKGVYIGGSSPQLKVDVDVCPME